MGRTGGRSGAGAGGPARRSGWRLLRSGFTPVGRPTGTEDTNPQGRDLLVAVYGSGLERLVMTTLLVTDQELIVAAESLTL